MIGDRFTLAGFLFRGLWLLWHRAWFAGLAVLAVDIVIAAAMALTGQVGFFYLLSFGLALIVGFEGQQWRVASRLAKGDHLLDRVEAADSEEALLRAAMKQSAGHQQGSPPPLPPRRHLAVNAAPDDPGEYIGLVPSGRQQ
ncbi:DUF2628 domain-containing protein [Pseudohoeflea coraliihabitans]|uniref:DUF2628 domain-containing protein n=1 Tax=Pseudohoeflea coraliihabitans TaxID=2860393 RepID=A0ABS6WT26_9HYPH|nr:DUF2628 domain-containing protein [Pseudohoeflea sp. DP4N28-3]